MIRVTSVLLFLACFFSATTYADVSLTSPYEMPGRDSFSRRPGFYDTSVQPARPQALAEWNPRKVTSVSRSVTVLKSLIVKVEGPKVVTRVEELRLTTTITNSGSETLRLIKEPSGILYSRLPTRRFHITHSTGVIPQFKGVQVKFSLREAIKLGHLTRLAPGQSISVEHDLSEAYDFTVSGFGRYHFKPRNRFFVVNSVTKRVTMVQAGSTRGTSVDWSGRLVARGNEQSHLNPEKPNEYIDCSEREKEMINDIAGIAKKLAYASVNYFQSSFPTNVKRYSKYYGACEGQKSHWDTVESRFTKIHQLLLTVSYTCSSIPGHDEDVELGGGEKVVLYPSFFGVEKPTISKAGEIIRVLSKLAGTKCQSTSYDVIREMLGPNGYKRMENGERGKWLDMAVNCPEAYQRFAESFADEATGELVESKVG